MTTHVSIIEREDRIMACRSSIADFTVDEVEEYLEEKGISNDVVINFGRNRVTVAAFLRLTEDNLRELVPLIGERTAVRKLLADNTQVRFSTGACTA